MRARSLDALRGRLEHLGRERLREAALHLRHPRPHAVARQPAADEDDEAVQARDPVAAVGERVDLELDLVVLASRGRPSARVRQVMSRRLVLTTPTAPIAAIQPSETPSAGQYDEQVVPAGAVGSVERAEREVRGDAVDVEQPEQADQQVSTRKIHTSVPTSAATWPCTTAPTRSRSAPRGRRRGRSAAASGPRGRRGAVGVDEREPRERDDDTTASARSANPTPTHAAATDFAGEHALAARRREQRRRDRAVPELGRDHRDPEDGGEHAGEAGRLDEPDLVVELAALEVVVEPIVAGDADPDESTITGR